MRSLLEIRECYWDNPMGAPGAPGDAGVKKFFEVAGGFLWHTVLHFKVEGLENLKPFDESGKGAVLAINHASLCDPPTVFLGFRPRVVRCMGKEEIFTKAGFLVAQVGSAMGAFPVKRSTADRKALKRAVMYVNAGEYVGIFPEGTRMRKKGMVPHYHAGTVLIARMAKAPIVPVGIRNTDRICPNGSHFPRYWQHITMRIGKPIDPADYAGVDKRIRNEVILNDVMRAVYALRDGVHVEQIPKDAIGLAGLIEAKEHGAR